MSAQLAVAVRDLSYRYPDGSLALRDLSIDIHEGEVLALLGPNGSGKSTLLRLMAEARLSEMSVSGRAAKPRARLFAPDRPVFRDWLSGVENATALLELRGFDRAAAKTAVETWLVRFDLVEDGDRPVGAYSSGMRRRLQMVVAFGAAPALGLLDEPLAGLDPMGRIKLGAALRQPGRPEDTIVFSTHDPEFAAAYGDRVAFLVEGRCAIVDTPAGLLERVGTRPRVEVRFGPGSGAGPETLGAPPEAVRSVNWNADGVLLDVDALRTALPEALTWLLSGDADITSIDIREPSLSDAFFVVTGTTLAEDAP